MIEEKYQLIEKSIQKYLDKYFKDLKIEISKSDYEDDYFTNIYNGETLQAEAQISNTTERELDELEHWLIKLIQVFDFSYYLDFENLEELHSFVR